MSAGDTRLYSVNRDVAHHFPQVMMHIANRLENGAWPFLKSLLDAYGVPEEELGKACETFCAFIATAHERGDTVTMEDALQASGFLAVHQAAQAVFMAYLGSVMAGIFFAGARDASLGGDSYKASVAGLVEAGARCAEMFKAKGQGETT
jgi:hypothetical protein